MESRHIASFSCHHLTCPSNLTDLLLVYCQHSLSSLSIVIAVCLTTDGVTFIIWLILFFGGFHSRYWSELLSLVELCWAQCGNTQTAELRLCDWLNWTVEVSLMSPPLVTSTLYCWAWFCLHCWLDVVRSMCPPTHSYFLVFWLCLCQKQLGESWTLLLSVCLPLCSAVCFFPRHVFHCWYLCHRYFVTSRGVCLDLEIVHSQLFCQMWFRLAAFNNWLSTRRETLPCTDIFILTIEACHGYHRPVIGNAGCGFSSPVSQAVIDINQQNIMCSLIPSAFTDLDLPNKPLYR